SPPMQADPGMSADPGHAVVPAEGAKEEPPVGEIQERAVPRMAPGVTPSQPIVPAAPAPTPGLSALPGEFALETFVGSGIVSDTLVQTPFGSTGVTMTGPGTPNYLTAVGGGGRTTDVVHTDATQVRDWEKWRLVKAGDLGSGYCYGIQAFTGFFLSAPGGGGRTTDAILANSPTMGPLHSPQRFR